MLLLFSILSLSSCTDYIEITNKDKVSQENFYRDETELNLALTGCYSTLRAPIASEWWLTEVRSDNTMMNVYNTSNQTNLQVYANDIFQAPTNDSFIESYWATTYQSLRSVNALLAGLKTSYNPTSGTINYNTSFTSVNDATRKRIAGEASFMRAYHYFKLVRLFGGVFLVDKPVSTEEALNLSRASVADIYKFIIADLKNASENCMSTTYASTSLANRGKVSSWAAKALLAKVYLTLGQKADALPLLTSVLSPSSGYSLVTTSGTTTSAYANVFTAANELNAEILFAVRFKSGTGIAGNGSSIANLFATNTSSISTQTKLLVPPGTRGSYNNPTEELYNSYAATDIRRDYTIKVYKPVPAATVNPQYAYTYWAAKHNTTSTITNDSELDWPVLRYSDVLLMYCEASTANATTLGYLNQVHTRAGLPALALTDLNTTAKYELAVANERRWEFALENQRWFDLLRFDKTMTTINSKAVMNNHFTAMMPFYIQYPDSKVDAVLPNLGVEQLKQLKLNVANDKFDLLPIPNLEISTNTTKPINQNPGY